MRGLRPRVEAPLDPRTTLSGAAERGLQTLRAPRYDLPASLVLALVLAHDPPPPPSSSLTPTYFLFIPSSSTFSACTLGDHFFSISSDLSYLCKKYFSYNRLFFSKRDLASVTFDDVSRCLTKLLFFSKKDLASVTFDDVSGCLTRKRLFFSKRIS